VGVYGIPVPADWSPLTKKKRLSVRDAGPFFLFFYLYFLFLSGRLRCSFPFFARRPRSGGGWPEQRALKLAPSARQPARRPAAFPQPAKNPAFKHTTTSWPPRVGPAAVGFKRASRRKRSPRSHTLFTVCPSRTASFLQSAPAPRVLFSLRAGWYGSDNLRDAEGAVPFLGHASILRPRSCPGLLRFFRPFVCVAGAAAQLVRPSFSASILYKFRVGRGLCGGWGYFLFPFFSSLPFSFLFFLFLPRRILRFGPAFCLLLFGKNGCRSVKKQNFSLVTIGIAIVRGAPLPARWSWETPRKL